MIYFLNHYCYSGYPSKISAQFHEDDLDGLENQLFVDLRTIKEKLTNIDDEYGKDISNLINFQQSTKKDVNKIWDNIYDMQEIGNITSRNIEEMYDKDILVLHNFRTETRNQISRLQKDIDSILELASRGHYEGIGGVRDQLEDGSDPSFGNINPLKALSTLLENKITFVQEEIKSFNDLVIKQQENDNVFRAQLQDVFEDVDRLKGTQRTMAQEEEKLKREIQRLKSVEIIDLTNRLDSCEERIDGMHSSQMKSTENKKNKNSVDAEKLLLVINEITKLKNQIYYLQQSIIILRTNGNVAISDDASEGINSNEGTTRDDVTPAAIPGNLAAYTTTALLNKPVLLPDGEMSTAIQRLEQHVSECTSSEKFLDFSREMKQKTDECSKKIENMKTEWKTDQKYANSYLKRNVTKLNKKLVGVSKRLEAAETNAKKYNIIVSGLTKTRKLERTTHLERLIKDFFRNVLGLPNVQFDEVRRLKDHTSTKVAIAKNSKTITDPILIKFPSVRIKTMVLKASRSMSDDNKSTYSIGEDFTDTVKKHRRRLVSFARKRSRITKKKWALKYNELYMNGKVFVFDSEKKRVVSKS